MEIISAWTMHSYLIISKCQQCNEKKRKKSRGRTGREAERAAERLNLGDLGDNFVVNRGSYLPSRVANISRHWYKASTFILEKLEEKWEWQRVWRERKKKVWEKGRRMEGEWNWGEDAEEGPRDETCVHQCVISLNVMYNHNLSFGTS